MSDSNLIMSGTMALDTSSRVPAISKNMTTEQIRETAVEFESFFLGQMLQPMFASIDTAPPFGGGYAEKMWRSMMVDEMGKSMAEAGGIGIADSIQREILRLQEAEN